MNRFAHFVKKESLHILRDVRTILVVIGNYYYFSVAIFFTSISSFVEPISN